MAEIIEHVTFINSIIAGSSDVASNVPSFILETHFSPTCTNSVNSHCSSRTVEGVSFLRGDQRRARVSTFSTSTFIKHMYICVYVFTNAYMYVLLRRLAAAVQTENTWPKRPSWWSAKTAEFRFLNLKFLWSFCVFFFANRAESFRNSPRRIFGSWRSDAELN